MVVRDLRGLRDPASGGRSDCGRRIFLANCNGLTPQGAAGYDRFAHCVTLRGLAMATYGPGPQRRHGGAGVSGRAAVGNWDRDGAGGGMVSGHESWPCAGGAVVVGAARRVAQLGVGSQEPLKVFVTSVCGRCLTGVGVVGAQLGAEGVGDLVLGGRW